MIPVWIKTFIMQNGMVGKSEKVETCIFGCQSLYTVKSTPIASRSISVYIPKMSIWVFTYILSIHDTINSNKFLKWKVLLFLFHHSFPMDKEKLPGAKHTHLPFCVYMVALTQTFLQRTALLWWHLKLIIIPMQSAWVYVSI